jgi:hypothetical protein
MTPETIITFHITAGVLFVGICVFFFSLLAIIWKGKKEMSDTIKEALVPIRETADGLKHDIDILKYNIKVICDHLIKSGGSFNPSELKATSPYQLTDEGMERIREMEFDTVFDEQKQSFFACIDTEKPTTKYDVEVAAIKSIYVLGDKPYMKFLKIFLYNTPTRTIENIAPTLGVYVRDKYLEKHPEITE